MLPRYHFKKDETDDDQSNKSLINLNDEKSKIVIEINDLNVNLTDHLNNFKRIFQYYVNIIEFVNNLKSKIDNSNPDYIKLSNLLNDIEINFNETQIKVDHLTNELKDLQIIRKKLSIDDKLDILNDTNSKITAIKNSNAKIGVILNDHNNKLIDNYNNLIKLEINRLKELETKNENEKFKVKELTKETNILNQTETDTISNQSSSILNSIDPISISDNYDENNESKLFMINNKNNKSSEWLFVKDKSNLNEIISNKSSLVSINENYMVL